MLVFCLRCVLHRALTSVSTVSSVNLIWRVQSVALLLMMCLAGWAEVAQAQRSITLYGLLDVGFSLQRVQAGSDSAKFLNPGERQNEFGMASGQQSGSRWGIKGTEALGSGLALHFVYESAVTANTGQSSGFTRQATLGLVDEGWGAIDLGRRISPGTEAFANIDPFDFSFGQSSLTSSMGATFIRFSNLVAYTSPNIGGLNLYAGWSSDTGLRHVNAGVSETAFGTSNKFRALSLGARFAREQWLFAAMYDVYYPPSGARVDAVKQWNAGVTYDLKVATLHAAYGQSIDGRLNGAGVLRGLETDGGDTNTSGAVVYSPGARTNQWMLGVTVPTGAAAKVFASVQQARPGGNYSADRRVTQTTLSVGYTYALSLRKNIYAYYSYMTAPELFKDAQSQGMGVGLRHAF